MTRLLYSCLMWLAQPFLRRKLSQRGVQEPGYLDAVAERFGRYAAMPGAPHRNTIWIHAVSLGETRAAAVLVASLRKHLPGMRLLLTHGTATGLAEGASLLQAGDAQTWQPWDTPGAVQRFLKHFKPRIGILMETEIWPNLVAGCQQRGVPLVLANARMSEKSLLQAKRLAWLSRPAYGALAAVWAQTDGDARRLTQLGATVAGVFGNLKFDATPNVEQLATGRAWRVGQSRPVVLLASSREGEETEFLGILKSFQLPEPVDREQHAINSVANDVQWLIVPRHPQRFDEVAALIESHGYAVSRRSTWPDGPPTAAWASAMGERPDANVIWLGDTLGEMTLYYGLSDVALLGGSFEPLGGQNLIEAAACGCPLVMGPHTFNFAEAAELALAAGAALRVRSLKQGVETARMLANDSPARTGMASAAAVFSNAHRGAVEKTVIAALALLDQQSVDAQ